jgi:hypothetical protein
LLVNGSLRISLTYAVPDRFDILRLS